MSKVIVTGGLGFVGKHVVERLMQEGYEVVITDIPQANVSAQPKSVQVEGLDITQKDDVINTFSKHKAAKYIVHLAAFATTSIKPEDLDRSKKINIDGSKNIIEAARKIDAERFIFMSSSAVYGNPLEEIITEAHPTNPVNNYGMTKLEGEKALSECSDLDSIIFRGANIYGPGQKNLLIPTLMNNIVSDKTSTVNNAIRDFVYVTDIADAISRGLSASDHESVYNLGTGKGISIKEIWEYISKTFQENDFKIPEVKYGEIRSDEVKKLALSNELAKKSLGWNIKVDMKEGLSATVKHFICEYKSTWKEY